MSIAVSRSLVVIMLTIWWAISPHRALKLEPCPKECVCSEQKFVELGGRVVNCSRMTFQGMTTTRILAELGSTTHDLIFTKNRLRDLDNFNRSLPLTSKRNLYALDLSMNDIARLIPGIFDDFENLKSLDLRKNKIGAIQPFTFKGLLRLRVLYLCENQIAHLNPGSFIGLTELKDLWLVGNFLKLLHFDVLAPLSSTLEYLHLTNNALHSLDVDILANLSQLQELWLDRNNISSLDEKLYHQFNYKTFRNINFQGNPFNCDCRLLWLRLWYANQFGSNGSSDSIPKCWQPIRLRGNYLNAIPNVDPTFTECACSLGPNAKPSSSSCLCRPGFQSGSNGTCKPCPLGWYKPNSGSGPCLSCTGGSSTNTLGASVCFCHEGYYLNRTNHRCTECPVHHYKMHRGPLREGPYGCFHCQSLAQSSKGSTSPSHCTCPSWTSMDAKGNCITKTRFRGQTPGHQLGNDGAGNGNRQGHNDIIIYVGAFLLVIVIATLILGRILIKRCHLKRMDVPEKIELGTVKTFLPSMAIEVGNYHEGWEIESSQVELGKVLGEGAFGVVYEGIATGLKNNPGPTLVAIKTLPENYSTEEVSALQSELKQLLYVGQHANVVSLLGCITTEGSLMLIMEYARHGDLLTYLKSKKHISIESEPWLPQDDVGRALLCADASEKISISEDALLAFAWQVAKGMTHLANIKCIHRDLATRNVLLADGFVVKISDFGLARAVYETGYYFKQSKGRLPFKWMAPEAILQGQYTTKSDVWSFGVLFWEILTLGGTPYPGVPINSLLDLLLSGYRMSRPQHCRPQFYEIMCSCWQEHPSDRPTFETLKEELEKLLSVISKNEYLNLNIS